MEKGQGRSSYYKVGGHQEVTAEHPPSYGQALPMKEGNRRTKRKAQAYKEDEAPRESIYETHIPAEKSQQVGRSCRAARGQPWIGEEQDLRFHHWVLLSSSLCLYKLVLPNSIL